MPNVKDSVSGHAPATEQISQIIFEQDKFIVHCAYLSYLKQGRGALFLDLTVSGGGTGLVKTSFVYLAEGSAPLADLADLIDGDAINLIRSYDPDRTVVLLVKLTDGRIVPMELQIHDLK